MTETTSVWFSPAPSAMASSRISLDFNLRAADLFFRELVVPGLGRIWFVRQLSWPLVALALHEELASKRADVANPTSICHGLEALACKLEYFDNPDKDSRSRRILGSRAFNRDHDSEVWLFHRLRQSVNYVRNTHRQSATRAIRFEGGLGFARGARFDQLELEPVGRALADAFLNQRVGKGGMRLRKWLLEWLGDKEGVLDWPGNLLQALSPEYPTSEERNVIRSRLLGMSTPDGEKRRRLANAIGRTITMPDIDGTVVDRLAESGHHDQAKQVVAARAFGAVLDRARNAVAILTQAIEPGRGGVRVATLSTDASLKRSLNDLRFVSKRYLEKADAAEVSEPTSREFANTVAAADDSAAIRLLVGRAGEVLGLADGCVVRGLQFRVVSSVAEPDDLEDGAASIEPDWTGRTFRIANFHAILRDIDQRGIR